MKIEQLAKEAKYAAIKLSAETTNKKNIALKEIADNLEKRKNEIFSANEQDIRAGEESNLAMPLIKRLKLGALMKKNKRK